MPTFGARLKRARRAAGLTQAKLAEAAKAHRASVQRWERGDDLPTVMTTLRLAAVVGTSLHYLMGLVDAPDRWLQVTLDERKLLELYRALPEHARRVLLDSARDLLQAQSGQRAKAS